jgi:competence ComEA-like helix-hairpin-helix protein
MKRIGSVICTLLTVVLMNMSLAAAQSPDKPEKTKAASMDMEKTAKKPDKPVDINNASEKELTMLPGVGPKIAKEIVAARPFQSIDDLKKIKGIGDKTFATLKPHVVCSPVKK